MIYDIKTYFTLYLILIFINASLIVYLMHISDRLEQAEHMINALVKYVTDVRVQ